VSLVNLVNLVQGRADMDHGRRVVHQVQAGQGQPAVVLEAGLNNGAASWERVMPLLAPHVRVVAYDRAGIGGSAPAPGLVTIDRQLGDLASVVTGLAAGPCVLAGHSWGGILVQLLAFRRPDLAAGLVLVDPGHEEMDGALPPPVRWGWRLLNAVRPDELHGDAPVTMAAIRELRAAARSFPDVPVIVLSAARGLPRKFRARWTTLQAGLAEAAPHGRHLVVDRTGHNIPGHRPDAVADAILAVAARAAGQISARGGPAANGTESAARASLNSM
jgi:pimeloyl-ACP methyl ester carboxylesterase